MYLLGIIHNLNFAILIVSEIYGRNRRLIREPGGSQKYTSNREVPRKYGRVGHHISNSRLLATDVNTETITSNHYEVILPFLVQSPWNLETWLNSVYYFCYCPAELFLWPLCTDHAQKAYVMWSLPSQSIGALAAAYEWPRQEPTEKRNVTAIHCCVMSPRTQRKHCSIIVGRVCAAGVA
jgi:hypothetical protein